VDNSRVVEFLGRFGLLIFPAKNGHAVKQLGPCVRIAPATSSQALILLIKTDTENGLDLV
jgi:hypothetical protein